MEDARDNAAGVGQAAAAAPKRAVGRRDSMRRRMSNMAPIVPHLTSAELKEKAAAERKVQLDLYTGLLKKVPCLGILDDSQFETLAAGLTPITFGHGEVVIQQGDRTDDCFWMLEGEVLVTERSSGNQINILARLKQHDYFGEIALMTDCVRQSSCTAVGKIKCMRLTRSKFDEVAQGVLRDRRSLTDDLEMMSKISIFSNMNADHRRLLVESMLPMHFSEGQYICKQDELGEHLHIILEGVARVSVRTDTGSQLTVAQLCKGALYYLTSTSFVRSRSQSRSHTPSYLSHMHSTKM
jgi:cAMP-dependent protein kinase regulator